MTQPVQPLPTPVIGREATTSLGAMVLAATARPRGPVLRTVRDAGPTLAGVELGRRIRDLARGLVALGIRPGDPVAVLGRTSLDWTLADCAVLAAGAVVVPIYHTNSPEETRYVLAHSGARAVICEDAAQVAKVDRVRADCPALEHTIIMTPTPGVLSLRDVANRGVEVDEHVVEDRLAGVGRDDAATIVYTSGTTGPPKGCVLTHGNCLATIDMYERRLALASDAVVFVFLPLAHVLARVTQLVAISVGGTVVYWSGDPAALLEDVAAAAPTHLPSVPRLFEKIHTKAMAGVDDGPAVKRRLFTWALSAGRRMRAAEASGRGPGRVLRAEHALADRLVLSKVRALFGQRLEIAVTGAAPISRDVLDFFDACGVRILEGYGLTESCAAATLNTPDAFRFGTVGRPLPGTEVDLAPDGEIRLRGPNIFPRYHEDPEATAAALDGDWLLSGDLGEVDADGFLRITGRKKDLIITSSGKNVTPANIEAALRESRWVSQAVVVGDNRPYLVALLTLDPDEVPALAERLGLAPGRRGHGARSRRCTRCSSRTSSSPTSASRASSRSSASRSSTTTSPRPVAS